MLAEKVVKFENESTKIYDQIEKFLAQHSYKSEGTRTAYESDIKMFFSILKKKDVQHLTLEDIQITLDDFEDYVAYLYNLRKDDGERQYANKTINRKVTSVKSLIRYLAGKKLVKDVSFLELMKSLPEESNQYGVLEAHEVFQMAELARKESFKGETKRLLILLSLDTCIRKTALLNLKWSNFIKKEDGYLIQVVDKGNKEFRQLISKDFYDELLTIKIDDSDKVFGIDRNRVDEMMKRLRKQMNIPDERNIVFHSIRKAGVTYRYRLTGDILEAQRAANHSSIGTTQIYLQHEDYGAMGAVSGGGKISEDLYKEVDHETLLEAISMMKKDYMLLLNMKINEIQKTK